MRPGLGILLTAVALVTAAGVVTTTSSTPASEIASVQVQLGDLMYDTARFREALEAYQLAEKYAEEPSLVTRAGMGVVRCALRVADFTLAASEAVRVLSSRPKDPEAVSLRADTLWASGLFDEAETSYKDALTMNPDSARARHGMARALATRGRLDEALNEAQAALRSDPRDGEIQHTVGAIYERMHKFEEAANAYSNYVNLLPNKDRSDKAAWSRAEIRFLNAFKDAVPFEMDTDDGGLHTVPFHLVNDKIIVRARVNGSSEMDFIMDTGSEQTVISRTTASRMGVTPITYTLSAGVGEVGLRGLQLAKLDSLQIGSMRMKNVPVLIKNPALRDLPRRESESFSPLALGLSARIDYEHQMLTMGRVLQDEPADIELPLRLYRLATVRGMVDSNQAVNFVVDTGGEVISISSATAKTLTRADATRHIPLKVYGTSGWDRDAFLLPGVDLAFAGIEFHNFPVVVLNLEAPSVLLGFQVGGIVGHRFLSHYRVDIDLNKSVLRLKKLQA